MRIRKTLSSSEIRATVAEPFSFVADIDVIQIVYAAGALKIVVTHGYIFEMLNWISTDPKTLESSTHPMNSKSGRSEDSK